MICSRNNLSTNPMLLELVDKVLAHERNRKGSVQTSQEIEIYFSFVGKFMPPDFEKEPTEEEISDGQDERWDKKRGHQERYFYPCIINTGERAEKGSLGMKKWFIGSGGYDIIGIRDFHQTRGAYNGQK